MRIGIEINGVLRDTIGKFEQTYEKYLIDSQNQSSEKIYNLSETGDAELDEGENVFEYKKTSDITSLDLDNHFSFKSKDELYSFMFEEYVMEIFGHSSSSEYSTFNDFNEIYLNLRDNHDVLIVSDEIGKSKPASLFFLSKFGCLVEKIKFYSNSTINSMWNEIDVLLTANPDLLLNHPDNKIVIKFDTNYNKNVITTYSISTLKDFEDKLKSILK
jgi:hypothetical protein